MTRFFYSRNGPIFQVPQFGQRYRAVVPSNVANASESAKRSPQPSDLEQVIRVLVVVESLLVVLVPVRSDRSVGTWCDMCFPFLDCIRLHHISIFIKVYLKPSQTSLYILTIQSDALSSGYILIGLVADIDCTSLKLKPMQKPIR